MQSFRGLAAWLRLCFLSVVVLALTHCTGGQRIRDPLGGKICSDAPSSKRPERGVACAFGKGSWGTAREGQDSLQMPCFDRCMGDLGKEMQALELSKPSPSSGPMVSPVTTNLVWGGEASRRLHTRLSAYHGLTKRCFKAFSSPVWWGSTMAWMWTHLTVNAQGITSPTLLCHNIPSPKLRRCLLCALSSLRVKAITSPWKLAQLSMFHPTNPRQRGFRTSSPPTFRWSKAPQSAQRNSKGGICKFGARSASLDPLGAKPCKEGLGCCYPCGIEGCDSVCMERCPRGIP